MIDSTNPRILADNIKNLFTQIKNIPVVKGNPSGTGYNTLLTKLQIGSNKYKLPANVVANPEGEATGSLAKLQVGDSILAVTQASSDYSETEIDTGRKWIDGKAIYEKVIAFESAKQISYNDWTNTSITIDYDFIIDAVGISSSGTSYGSLIAFPDNGSLKLQTGRNGSNISLTYLIIRYTKSSS